jgi:tryptophan synthase alpha chain
MNGHQRIRAALAEREGAAALLPFMTAGIPSPARSVDLFVAMSDAGADVFEVGIPYSDPLMDGPVIMAASEAALAAGTTIRVALGIIEQVASRTGKPVLAMTYANPVMQVGWQAFVDQLENVGAAGIIVPDLPLEECGPLRAAAAARGLGVVQFVSPTSDDERIEAVAVADPAFIYGVAEMGVTGERASASSHARALSERVREHTKAPLVFGVGISTPEQARAVRDLADGVIVGTAMVRRVLEADSPESAARSLSEAVAAFAAALH